ncbi:MAG: PaaI family thioesterase [Rhizobiales bacterium]|nr:PaaI family thioesterase [Hyphomicrobiales bacterium]
MSGTPRFEPKNPDYRHIATDTFERQCAMRTLGISIARLEPGEVELAMAYSADLTQQNGFVHAGIITAGLDSACGIAAFTLMPAGSDILTVEFKTNLLAPARGQRFAFRGSVVKPGRTLTVCEARAYADEDGNETLVATMTGTLMALPRRASAPLQNKAVAPA